MSEYKIKFISNSSMLDDIAGSNVLVEHSGMMARVAPDSIKSFVLEDLPKELPDVTEADAGKFLAVDENGEWVLRELTNNPLVIFETVSEVPNDSAPGEDVVNTDDVDPAAAAKVSLNVSYTDIFNAVMSNRAVVFRNQETSETGQVVEWYETIQVMFGMEPETSEYVVSVTRSGSTRSYYSTDPDTEVSYNTGDTDPKNGAGQK